MANIIAQIGGVMRQFLDISGLYSHRAGTCWAEVVDLCDRSARQLGIISGIVTIGTPVTITGIVDISGPVSVENTVTITGSGLSAADLNAEIYTDGYPVSETNPVFVEDVWETTTISAFTGTATDRVYTIPAAYREYYINHIFVTFTTIASDADRQLEVQFRDANDNVILAIVPGVAQAAGNTYRYAIGPALADHLGVRDGDYVMTPMPPNVLLPAGYDVRVFDNNTIGAAADSIVVRMQVMRPSA
jgi:hypothetical protein